MENFDVDNVSTCCPNTNTCNNDIVDLLIGTLRGLISEECLLSLKMAAVQDVEITM